MGCSEAWDHPVPALTQLPGGHRFSAYLRCLAWPTTMRTPSACGTLEVPPIERKAGGAAIESAASRESVATGESGYTMLSDNPPAGRAPLVG
jgi:hypothetical protein